MPIEATRSGLCSMTSPTPAGLRKTWPRARPPCWLFPAGPDGFHAGLGDTQIGFPIAAAHADAAETVAVDENGHTAFHRRPSFRSRRQRQTDGVADVEVLTNGALGRGRTSIGGGAHGLGGRRMHGV